jgi:hypothetical protein
MKISMKKLLDWMEKVCVCVWYTVFLLNLNSWLNWDALDTIIYLITWYHIKLVQWREEIVYLIYQYRIRRWYKMFTFLLKWPCLFLQKCERERERETDDRIQRGDILLVGRWGDFHFIKNVFTSCFQKFVHIH